jgi:hypothetical protein
MAVAVTEARHVTALPRSSLLRLGHLLHGKAKAGADLGKGDNRRVRPLLRVRRLSGAGPKWPSNAVAR